MSVKENLKYHTNFQVIESNVPPKNNRSGSKNYRQLHQRAIVLGRVLGKSGKYHQNQEVYSSKGLIGTIKACHSKDPPKVGVYEV